jgi:hypothetical protein
MIDVDVFNQFYLKFVSLGILFYDSLKKDRIKSYTRFAST